MANKKIDKTSSINNLSTNIAGFVLDAMQGKIIGDRVRALETKATLCQYVITASTWIYLAIGVKKFIILRNVELSGADAVLIAHEIQHLIFNSKGYPSIRLTEIGSRDYSNLNLATILVNTLAVQ